MPQVHPTAVVDDQATLAGDVTIGPWCVVGAKVRIGPGTRVMERVSLRGPMVVGKNNRIYPGACLGMEPQDLKFNPDMDGAGVVIGDHNVIREGATIHRATRDKPTTLGDHNFLMANSHLAHDVAVGNHCVLANGALLGGHVEVMDHAVFGGNSAVHQQCRVGRLAMISGGACVSRDVPPFCMVFNTRRVGGINLIGLRRVGLGSHIDSIRKAFDLYYRQGLSSSNACQRIEGELGDDGLCLELVAFLRTTTRGITKYERDRD